MSIPLTIALPIAVQAAPGFTIYDNAESAWETAVGSWLAEDFNDGTLNPEISVVSDNGLVLSGGFWWDALMYDPPKTYTTWTFTVPIYAFGGTWDLGSFWQDGFGHYVGGPGSNIEVLINGSWVNIGVIDREYQWVFWGFVSDAPFTQVRLQAYNSEGWVERYRLDNLKYAPACGIKIVTPSGGMPFDIQAEPQPKMPTIECRAEVIGITPDPTATTKFTWEAQCSYKAPGIWTPAFDSKGNYAGYYYQSNYEFKHTFPQNTVEGGQWTVNLGNTFCGGTLSITVKATIEGVEYSDTVEVIIKGDNPSIGTIKSALSATIDPADTTPRLSKEFLQAICSVESSFHQFRLSDHMPNYGEPGGYGLMQIDVPPNYFWNKLLAKYPGDSAKVKELLRAYQNDLMWNWQENIKAGLQALNDLSAATKKLEKSAKPPKFSGDALVEQDMFERNVASLYHSNNNYYKWNAATGTWEVNDPLSRGGPIAQGDGITTEFSGELKATPVVTGSVKIVAVVAGQSVMILDNGAGQLSGSDVTGTISYGDGAWTLKFTNPPDASTDISVNYQRPNPGVTYANIVMDRKASLSS